MQIGSASSVLLTTLLGYTRFLANTLDNITAFTDVQITALLNQEYHLTQTFLFSQLMFDWKENTLEGTGDGLLDLTAGTKTTSFPTGLLTLDRLEVNYTGGDNNWSLSTPRKLESIDSAVANTASNSPIKGTYKNPIHWVRDGVIYLDPIPNQDVTSGMKVHCTIIATDLAVGGAGDALTPVIATPFHKLLCIEPAIEYLNSKEQTTKIPKLIEQKRALRIELVNHYSTRQSDTKSTIKPKIRNMQ